MAELATETSAKTVGGPKAADSMTIPPRSGASLGNAATVHHLGATGPGASSEATIQPRSGASLGNAATVRHLGATGLGGSPDATGMHSRHGHTALGPDTDVAGMTFTQLEDELRGIQAHLDANPVSSLENDRLMQRLAAVRAELVKRRRQEAVGHARRSEGAAATRVPRSATQSLRIFATMTDAELNDEVNAIHDDLRFGGPMVDRSTLTSSLPRLEAERLRRVNEAAARARVEAIRRAFMPKSGSDDRAVLIELMTKIESIRPSGSASGLYSLVYEGQVLVVTASEYNQIRASAREIMSVNLRKVRTKAESAEYQYLAQLEINQDQWFVSGVVEFFGGISDPGESIRQNVRFARANADAAQALVERGELVRGAQFFSQSEVFATLAKKASQAYVDDLIATAETTVTVLEVTAVVAAATVVVIAAILAAPLVVSAAQAAPLVLMLSTAAVPAAEVTAGAATAVEVTAVVGTAAEVAATAGTAAEVAATAGTAAEVATTAGTAAAAAPAAAPAAAAAAAPAAAAAATPAAAAPAVTSAAALATAAAAASTTISSDSPAPADPEKEEEEEKKPKVPSGRLENDPRDHIPIVWLKHESFYTDPIRLLDQLGQPRDYEMRTPRQPLEFNFFIGVAPAYLPYVGKSVQLQWVRGTDDRGPAVERFRTVLNRHAWTDGDTHQIDHVQELMWSGPDDEENLWPLKKETNEAAGRGFMNMRVTYSNVPGGGPATPTTTNVRIGAGMEAAPPDELVGRWFVIRGYQRP